MPPTGSPPSSPGPLAPLLLLVGLLPAAACSDYSYHEFEQVDSFFQSAAEENDILLVVDDSASMEPYQEELGAHFDEFLSWFITAGVNYRVAVITTDVVSETAGRIRGEVLTPDTQAAGQVFAEMVAVGTEGNGTEMGFEAVRMAVIEEEGVSANGDFLRPEAFLSVIFVSDEFDSSPDPITAYVAELQASKDYARDKVRVGALVALELDNCHGFGSRTGLEYAAAAELTGGEYFDICDTDYSASLTEMSQNISRLFDVFYLTGLPDTGSLEVYVDDVEVPCSEGSWTYETRTYQGETRGAIVFDQDSLPALGAKLSVRYNFGTGDLEPFCSGGA